MTDNVSGANTLDREHGPSAKATVSSSRDEGGFFDLIGHRTTVRIEFVAGATTFATAAYLAIVIPSILASGGMDRAAVTTAVLIMFGMGTLLMGIYARLPFVVGPGIGGSALVATTLVLTERVPWQTAMGIAFWSGLSFLVLTLCGMREIVVRVVPAAVTAALSAAIGLFIAVLGFRNAGLVTANLTANALTLGNLASAGAGVALVGLAVAVFCQQRKIRGGILIAILVSTLAGIPLGVTAVPEHIFALPKGNRCHSFQIELFCAGDQWSICRRLHVAL